MNNRPNIIMGAIKDFNDPERGRYVVPFNMERIGYLATKRLHERLQNPYLDIIHSLLFVDNILEK